MTRARRYNAESLPGRSVSPAGDNRSIPVSSPVACDGFVPHAARLNRDGRTIPERLSFCMDRDFAL